MVQSAVASRSAISSPPGDHAARWLALGTLWLLLFASVALLAHQRAYEPFDPPLAQQVQTLRSPQLDTLMADLSVFGFALGGGIAFALAALVLLVLRRGLELLGLVLTGMGDALGQVIKQVVAEPRPTPELVQVLVPDRGFGFPSAHTLHYVLFFGFLLFLSLHLLRPSAGRTLLALVLLVPIVLIGLSRVYLGDHWPSQVLGGYLLGLGCLSLLIALYERLQAAWVTRAHPTQAQARVTADLGD